LGIKNLLEYVGTFSGWVKEGFPVCTLKTQGVVKALFKRFNSQVWFINIF
jgi:hypothetical protein